MLRRNKRKLHTKYNLDNRKIKIMTHFCNFIIFLLNTITKKYFTYQRVKFRKIEHKIKKDIFKNSIPNLMKMTLEEFCNLKISVKWKNINSIDNSKSFLIFKLIRNNPLNDLNLYDIYEKYYLNAETIQIMNIKNHNVIINKLKNFNNLIEKQNDSKYINLLKDASNIIKNIALQNFQNENTNYTNNSIALNQEFNYNILNNIIEPFIFPNDENDVFGIDNNPFNILKYD
jgi:hypothetical protein